MAKFIVVFSKFAAFIIVIAELIVIFSKFVSSLFSWLNLLLCLVSLLLHHCHG